MSSGLSVCIYVFRYFLLSLFLPSLPSFFSFAFRLLFISLVIYLFLYIVCYFFLCFISYVLISCVRSLYLPLLPSLFRSVFLSFVI